MKAHANAQLGSFGERALSAYGRGDRIVRAREGDEERVPFGSHLDAVVRCEGFSQKLAMYVLEVRIPFVADLTDGLRRSLDVRE
jgi:hypothetical protein